MSTSAVASQSFAPNIASGTLVWSDEFDNSTGAPAQPNPAVWTYDTGLGATCCGNNELETYCAWGSSVSPCDPTNPNAYVGTDGYLHIVARQPSPAVYTSARLKSQGLFSADYGRFEARISCRKGRECGRPSGCLATAPPPSAGQPAASRTSWSTSTSAAGLDRRFNPRERRRHGHEYFGAGQPFQRRRLAHLRNDLVAGAGAVLCRFAIEHIRHRRSQQCDGYRCGVGLRSEVSWLHHPEPGRGRRLAGLARCHDAVPSETLVDYVRIYTN